MKLATLKKEQSVAGFLFNLLGNRRNLATQIAMSGEARRSGRKRDQRQQTISKQRRLQAGPFQRGNSSYAAISVFLPLFYFKFRYSQFTPPLSDQSQVFKIGLRTQLD